MRRLRFALVGLFVLLVPVDVLFQHLSFRTSGWDLGIYHQALSKLSQFESVNPMVTVHGQRIFNDHFDPILLAFAPLFRLWDSAALLILLDLLATMVALAPILLTARRIAEGIADHRAREWLLTAVTAGWLFSDFVWKAHFFPSHPTHWAAAFLAWMLYYYEARRFGTGFWISLIGLLLCKEEFPFLGMAAAGAMFLKGHRRQALLVMFASSAVALFAFAIRPWMWGVTYPHGEFLGMMFSKPAVYVSRWLATVIDRRVLVPLALMAFWLAGASLRRNWDLGLIMAAPLLIRGLSLQRDAFNFHYAAVLMPFIMFVMLRESAAYANRPATVRRWGFRLALVAFVSLAARPSPFHHPLSRGIYYLRNADTIADMRRAAESLGDAGLAVSAPNNWVPQLTARDDITMPSSWLERGEPHRVDAWVWDEQGDYYPSKLGMAELQAQVTDALGGEAAFRRERFGSRVEVWRRLEPSEKEPRTTVER